MPVKYKFPYVLEPDYEHIYTQEEQKELIKCAMDVIYFAENYYTVIDADPNSTETEKIIELYDYQKNMLRSFQANQFNIILSARQIGKALDITTPILTEEGFKPLEIIDVGDFIYSPSGKKTRVNYVTDIMYDHDVYEIEFDNGEKIKADKDHIWNVSCADWQRYEEKYKNLTTEEIIPIYESLKNRSKPSSLFIPVTECLEFEEKQVSIDPYVLGLWLGDGNKNDGRITCSVEDYDHYKEVIERKGYKVSDFRPDGRRDTTGNFNIYGLVTDLKKLNLYRNKHIPKDYFLNSKEVRIELLQGLMDSDGYANNKGTCQFYQSEENLFLDVVILISSLGIKTKTTKKETECKDCNILTFVCNDYDVFKLERKLTRQKNIENNHPKNKRIYIKSITKCESVPVKCIQVEDESHLFLCGNRLIPTHNTTVSCIFMLWYALFHENKTVGILANQHSTAMEIIGDIKKAQERLPPFLKHGVIEYNKTNITFSNGTEVFAKATSENALRGHTMSLVFLDEFAFVPQNIADAFWASNYPTISKSNGKIIIVSTPKGNAGLYHQIWSEAESGENTFVPHKVNWWEVPGRDEKWKAVMLKNMSQLKFNQEFGCSFEGSSQTLIDGKYLVKLKSTDPAYTYGNHYFIWKKPEAGRVYTASVDSAQGTYGDNSVINIYDVTDFPTKQRYEQVALYVRNDLGIFDFAEETVKICKQWNNPPVIIESNSGLGDVLLKVMYEEHDYEYVFYDYETGKYGINANKKTKPAALGFFKEDVESMKTTIHAEQLIKELGYFEEERPGIYKARKGNGFHDDIVTTAYWTSYMLRSRWWDNNWEYIFQQAEAMPEPDMTDDIGYEEQFEAFKKSYSRQFENQMSDFEAELMDDTDEVDRIHQKMMQKRGEASTFRFY